MKKIIVVLTLALYSNFTLAKDIPKISLSLLHRQTSYIPLYKKNIIPYKRTRDLKKSQNSYTDIFFEEDKALVEDAKELSNVLELAISKLPDDETITGRFEALGWNLDNSEIKITVHISDTMGNKQNCSDSSIDVKLSRINSKSERITDVSHVRFPKKSKGCGVSLFDDSNSDINAKITRGKEIIFDLLDSAVNNNNANPTGNSFSNTSRNNFKPESEEKVPQKIKSTPASSLKE